MSHEQKAKIDDLIRASICGKQVKAETLDSINMNCRSSNIPLSLIWQELHAT